MPNEKLKVRCPSCDMMQWEAATCRRCRKPLPAPEVHVQVVHVDQFSLGAPVLPMSEYQRKAIVLALITTRSICKAAKELGMGKTTLYRQAREHGLYTGHRNWIDRLTERQDGQPRN